MTTASRWSLRNIYLYLVCLITLVMVIVAAVGVVRDVAGLVYPDPLGFEEPYVPKDVADESDAETVERNLDAQRASERRWTILSLVGDLAMLLVAGPIYLYHWRKIEGEAGLTGPAEEGSAGDAGA